MLWFFVVTWTVELVAAATASIVLKKSEALLGSRTFVVWPFFFRAESQVRAPSSPWRSKRSWRVDQGTDHDLMFPHHPRLSLFLCEQGCHSSLFRQ